MNNDQIALYLNDHPEFFNQYPELLARIQSIAPEDMPLKPVKTLNIADRILKRAQADKENMKNQLVSFMEISQANEKIQENLFAIDRIIMYSLNFSQMIGQLREEIIKRFKIPGVQIILMDGDEHLMERCLKERLDKNAIDGLQFVDTDTVSGWFGDDLKPVLRAEMTEGSEIFGATSELNIQSEALIPIILHGNLIGAMALGSENPHHFHKGLRTDLLERTADKLGIAIENVLLLDLMKNQPVLDSKTGLYNEIYLDPVLRREFGWAQCYGKSLSLIKMHIDSFEELVNTYGKSRIKKGLAGSRESACGEQPRGRYYDQLRRRGFPDFTAGYVGTGCRANRSANPENAGHPHVSGTGKRLREDYFWSGGHLRQGDRFSGRSVGGGFGRLGKGQEQKDSALTV